MVAEIIACTGSPQLLVEYGSQVLAPSISYRT